MNGKMSGIEFESKASKSQLLKQAREYVALRKNAFSRDEQARWFAGCESAKPENPFCRYEQERINASSQSRPSSDSKAERRAIGSLLREHQFGKIAGFEYQDVVGALGSIGDAQNALTIAKQYFLFWAPSTTELMTPVFGLGSALLIGLGFYRLVRTRETTRSYLIIFWIVCLLPVLLLNPNFTSVTFVPSVLMMAAGLTSLIGYWYRLFPLNPYARIIGLIPIIILVGALIITGLARYIYGYHYSPGVAPLFSNDLALIPSDTKQLVVSENEKPFFSAVAQYRDTLDIVTSPTADTFTATREARRQFSDDTIVDIITSSRSSEADRFYVMKRP